MAEQTGRGVFVLALTSNPSGPEVQHARDGEGQSVAAVIARKVSELNRGVEPMGDVGLVVGATIGEGAEVAGVDLAGFGGPILAPGFGAQGAGGPEVRKVFGDALPRVLIVAARSVLARGPGIGQLRDGIVGILEELGR
jgi:orotidine-5'-phosphate decarboxylase